MRGRPLKSNRTLIIVRHAHRDKEMGSAFDNGLSAKGRKQALKAAKYFHSTFPSLKDCLFLSSPKKRCLETLLPFVADDRGRIKELQCLSEGEPIDKKVDEFLKAFKNFRAQVVVACSHGDWIPAIMERITGERVELKKGAWARFEGGADLLKLSEIIQKF